MKLTVAKDVMDSRSWNADVVLGWLEEEEEEERFWATFWKPARIF